MSIATFEVAADQRDRIRRLEAQVAHLEVWNLAPREGLWPVPTNGTTQAEPPSEHRGSVARPVSIGDGRPDEPPDDPDDGRWASRFAAEPELLDDYFEATA